MLAKHIREAFDATKADKGYFHEYEHMYSLVFSSIELKSLLEIGVREGASIKSWRMLFPDSYIVGMDIEPCNIENCITGDSSKFDTTSLNNFDVIVDDGSHRCRDQIATFLNFKDKFNYFYIIEDVNYTQFNEPDPDVMVKRIVEVIKDNGFNHIAVFDSQNNVKKAKAILVIRSC